MSLGLLVSLLVAARPAVQPTFRGEVEGLDFAGHSSGVVATFAEGTKLAQGKAVVDACGAPVSGRATVRAGFLRTPKAQLAVAHPPEPPTARAVLSLAICLSKQAGVKETHAWFYPRADSGVEVEAVWRFQQGVRLDRTVHSFRDDPEYARYVRRAITRAEFLAHQWKGDPLSELVRALGLPGRDALERHGALMWESGEYPQDAGEDLARTQVFLPTGLALEVLQEAESSKASPSKLIGEALAAAQKDKALAAEGGTELDATAKERGLTLYLPRALLAATEAVGDARGESVSVIVRKAWQRWRDEHQQSKNKEKSP
jgi:hypothetical protein